MLAEGRMTRSSSASCPHGDRSCRHTRGDNSAAGAAQDTELRPQLVHTPVQPLTPHFSVAPNTCTPSFLVIGTQKGGTSSVHQYIRDNVHPGLWTTKNKEQDYFNREIERNILLQEYLHRFPFVGEKDRPLLGKCDEFQAALSEGKLEGPIAMGEVSPNYLPTWRAPRRVAESLPGVKIVALLKHPGARFISAYNMWWQSQMCKGLAWQMADCFTKLNDIPKQELIEDYVDNLHQRLESELAEFAMCHRALGGLVDEEDLMIECWERGLGQAGAEGLQPGGGLDTYHLEMKLERNATLWRGVYVDQLARWFDEIPPDRFLLWTSEDFDQEPGVHMAQLASWLGLDGGHTRDEVTQHKYHIRKKLVGAPEDVQQQLLAFYRPHNVRLFQLLKSNGFSELAARLEATWNVWPAMDEE